jgi:cell division protein FtsI (penicillin-binding protein 3)
VNDRDLQRTLVKLRWRMRIVLVCFALVFIGLTARAVHLQVFDEAFLTEQGEARHLRVEQIAAHRGTITDRNGEPLAVSTPVDSVWANPRELAESGADVTALARALEMDKSDLLRRVTRSTNRNFLYLRRHMSPTAAESVQALHVPGVYLQREYRRYYPAGEVVGHLLGFTNVDDQGLEGLELAFDDWLTGKSGSKRVLRDRFGRSVEDVEGIEAPSPGRTLVSSIDLRIQYLTYRALKAAVQENHARSGSVVVLDVTTGEVLAVANQPAFNPNDREQYTASRYRNRAVTDIFEPGSSFKTMVMAAALESGRYQPDTRIDTTPVVIGTKLIEDKHDLGIIDATTVLAKSSNVGMTKIALSLEREQLWSVLAQLGFGQLTASGFPGESAGLLVRNTHWSSVSVATLSYGYGVSVTPLQLAQAYAVVANDGMHMPVSFVREDHPPPAERVLSEHSVQELTQMLEAVVSSEGTGVRAAVPGYRVAGKTGTARKSQAGGYADNRYVAVFAGFAPASQPRVAIVVVIDEPSAGIYYGGDVAAPVFSAVMAGALRVLAVAPDTTLGPPVLLAHAPVEAAGAP